MQTFNAPFHFIWCSQQHTHTLDFFFTSPPLAPYKRKFHDLHAAHFSICGYALQISTFRCRNYTIYSCRFYETKCRHGRPYRFMSPKCNEACILIAPLFFTLISVELISIVGFEWHLLGVCFVFLYPMHVNAHAGNWIIKN